MLSGELARRYGHEGLPDDTIHVQLNGTAGQSLGAFLARGVTLDLVGEANDYVGKGLSGGRIIVRPTNDFRGQADENIIVGNTVMYGAIEGVIQQFEIFMTNRGWDVPIAETYGAIEGPNGELGYYIVGDGDKNPWRVKVRPPCFIHLQALPKMLEGHQIADVVAVLGSLNLIAAELDR